VLDTLAGLVFPLSCPGCGAPAELVCPTCAATLRPPPPVRPPPGVDAWFAPFSYEGVARELVARVKYRRAHAVVGWLAAAMAADVTVPADAVVAWAPTTPARRRERGFDHAELLARRFATRLDMPVRSLLTRGPGAPQTGLAAAARGRGPRFSTRGHPAATVVVVDDVATTGATLRAAAEALRSAGARRIVAITAARTPPPG